MHLAATAHARTSACGSFEANRLYGSEGGVAKAIPTPIRSCARRRSDRAAGTGGCSAGPNQRMGPRKPYLAVPVTHSCQRGGMGKEVSCDIKGVDFVCTASAHPCRR